MLGLNHLANHNRKYVEIRYHRWQEGYGILRRMAAYRSWPIHGRNRSYVLGFPIL